MPAPLQQNAGRHRCQQRLLQRLGLAITRVRADDGEPHETGRAGQCRRQNVARRRGSQILRITDPECVGKFRLRREAVSAPETRTRTRLVGRRDRRCLRGGHVDGWSGRWHHGSGHRGGHRR
jgi:hypothetical protein